MQEATKSRHHVQVTRTTIPTWSGPALRASIAQKGWTLAQTAARVDVAEARVQRWTYGSVPDPETFVRLAEVLDVPTTLLAPLSSSPTLLERRWHAGLSVTALAERLGRSPAYIARLLRGGDPIAPATLPDWAEAIGITTAEVVQAWESTRAQLIGD